MNLLIVIPGGLDREAGKLTPVLPPILSCLAQNNTLRVVLTNQDSHYREYDLSGISVVSLPTTRAHRALAQYRAIKTYCEQYNFTPDLVHAFWLGMPTLLSALVARHFKVPLFATVWGGELVELPEIAYGGLHGWRRRQLHRLSALVAQGYSLGSQYLKDRIPPKLALGAEIIPLGIDTQFWHQTEPNVIHNCCNILHLGSLSPVKNPTLLVELALTLSARKFPFKITSVGIDTLNGEVQQLAVKHGVYSSIEFAGHLTPKEVRKLMGNMHFICQTSLFESQGVAMMEAVSQGLCPTGTRVGWLSDAGIGESPRCSDLANGIADDIMTLWNDEALRLERVRKLRATLRGLSAKNTAAAFENSYSALVANQAEA